jgi:PAS domain S-box-containing protein
MKLITLLITDKNGHIEYINPGFNRLTGCNLEEIIGRDIKLWQTKKPLLD